MGCSLQSYSPVKTSSTHIEKNKRIKFQEADVVSISHEYDDS
jgi:hypothetical protein